MENSYPINMSQMSSEEIDDYNVAHFEALMNAIEAGAKFIRTNPLAKMPELRMEMLASWPYRNDVFLNKAVELIMGSRSVYSHLAQKEPI